MRDKLTSTELQFGDIASIDREVENLTAKIMHLSAGKSADRRGILSRIENLQNRRVDLSEPKDFRIIATMIKK